MFQFHYCVRIREMKDRSPHAFRSCFNACFGTYHMRNPLLKRLTIFFSPLLIISFSVCSLAQTAKTPDRQVAVTIDDLPAGMADRLPASEITAMTTKLLGALRDQKVPVVGFVNEKKLYKPGEVDERIKALTMWLDYGFDLGNHTYSHMSLNQAGLSAWEDDVIQGESVLKLLLAAHKKKLRYFRHPYLDVGRDLQTRRESEAFLTQRGYRIAPITLDGWDWMFAGVYEDAKQRNDTDLQQKLVKDYLAHHEAEFAYEEQLSMNVLGYEPKQILLLHASDLEADHIGELLDVLRHRGYRFITLEEALGDSAYSLPNTYVGEEGTGWIEQWAISQGKIPQPGPAMPQWVIDKSNALRLPNGQVSTY
jgi:peptidoglycan/xylan/chitin deacetylase (PgdA/CDA1 family)